MVSTTPCHGAWHIAHCTSGRISGKTDSGEVLERDLETLLQKLANIISIMSDQSQSGKGGVSQIFRARCTCSCLLLTRHTCSHGEGDVGVLLEWDELWTR